MKPPLVKVCGLTGAADARLALSLGADLIGFVMAESPRRVTLVQARVIRRYLPEDAPVVAVFRNQEAAFVRKAVAVLRPAMLQFHGAEPPGFCASFGLPYLKALEAPAEGETGWPVSLAWRSSAAMLLADLPKGAAAGVMTTGRARAAVSCGMPVLLAGGLTPENVAALVSAARPAGVDVARGVESTPGRKDPDRLRRFMSIIRDTRE